MPANRLRTLPATALAALLAVVAGCSTATPTAEAAGQPRSGGTLTWAVETEPITLNPHQYAQAKARLLVWNTFESLLTYDQQGKLVPWLATGWTVTPDGLSYTLTLRDRVTFSDGTPFDAAAVKANIDKLLEPGYAPAVAAVQLRNLKAVEVGRPAHRTARPQRAGRAHPRLPRLPTGRAGLPEVAAPGEEPQGRRHRRGRHRAVRAGPLRPRPGAALPAQPGYDWAPPTADAHRPGVPRRDHLPVPQGVGGTRRRPHVQPGAGHRGGARHRPAAGQPATGRCA